MNQAASMQSPERESPEYMRYLDKIQATFILRQCAVKLFTTDVENLFDIYLNALPPEIRQHNNCNACRKFFNTYGGLVRIEADGSLMPIMWDSDDAPQEFKEAVLAVYRAVRRAKVTGVFISSEREYGQHKTGLWCHIAVTPPLARVYKPTKLNAHQVMAEKLEDYKNVIRALKDFPKPIIEQALTLLKSDALYRSEKVLGQAQWLYDLLTHLEGSHHYGNTVWKFVAEAPAGFCHPRSSMIGTLLEDIASGMDFAQVSRRFKEKMDPLAYQRPTAAPKAGNIAQAEKLMAKLGAEGSLRRRFGTLADVKAFWLSTPKNKPSQTGGIFSHLKPKEESVLPDTMPMQPLTMTWEKFARTILPGAKRISLLVPSGNANFINLTTAVIPDAPPILQWDVEGNRNPVGYYVYRSGSQAANWGLQPGSWVNVPAISKMPHEWTMELTQHAKGVILFIDGAKDSRNSSLALFPEILKSEYREIRSTLEAFSSAGKLEGEEAQSAAGIGIHNGSAPNLTLKVESDIGSAMLYKIDRLD